VSVSTYLLIGLIYSGYSVPKAIKEMRKDKPELFAKHDAEATVISALVGLIISTLLWPAVITAAIMRKVRRAK
jgi:hypothetical protein